MAKNIIKQQDNIIMYHHTGTWRFTGCQCFKDCSCNEDFIPTKYDYYSVKRVGKKTTIHQDLENAEIRYNYVLTLNKSNEHSNSNP